MHATTGTHCALLRIACRAPEHLQEVIASLGKLGKTTTSIVLSTQHESRARVAVEANTIETKGNKKKAQ